MAKKKPQTRRQAPQKPASRGWLVPVAALSAFIGFLIYLDQVPDDDRPSTPDQVAPVPAEDGQSDETASSPEFRFYDMLPESEVVPPDVEAYEPGPDAAAREIEYILQTGSFRSHEDAERHRAQIGFQGLQAQISEIKPEDGSTWYRVQVGPYQNRSEMNRAIDRLVEINIQPLVRERSTRNDEG